MPLGVLARVARTHPFKFGCVFSCAKTSFSDWLVQTAVERRERVDWRRNGTFALFGLVYLGGVQYTLYVPIFSRLFPAAEAFAAAPVAAKLADFAGQRRMLAQVVLDQFVHHPLAYFPCFYAIKELVNGGSPMDGVRKYQKNMSEDLVALWKIWVPSTIINFTFMPMYLRIPWVATTSLVWTCILSAMRGGSDTFETDPEVAEEFFGNQGRARLRMKLTHPAAERTSLYNSADEHVLLTVTGHDRVGYINELTAEVVTCGGDILDARMYKLGGVFVANMLVAAKPDSMTKMLKSLSDLEGMQVNVQKTQPWLESDASPEEAELHFNATLHVAGPDKEGIIERLSAACKESRVDIGQLSCALEWHRSADGVFQKWCAIKGSVRAYEDIDEGALRRRLTAVEKDMDLTVRLSVAES